MTTKMFRLVLLVHFVGVFKSVTSTHTPNYTPFQFTFNPARLNELPWQHMQHLLINYTCENLTISEHGSWRYETVEKDTSQRTLHIFSRNADVVTVSDSNHAVFPINCTDDQNELSVSVTGKFLGNTSLAMYVKYNASSEILYSDYQVVVVNEETTLYTTFIVVVATLVAVLNFGFGCIIKLDTVKEILKKPSAVVTGLLCQVILMPLLGIAITKAFQMEVMLAFGVFVVACAPGGSGSNVWTYLLNGDLDLSMTMTLFSKTLALATMPAWLFAVSRIYVSDDVTISVPYVNLVTGLLSLVIPLFLGILLNRWKPNVAKTLSKAIKPLAFVFILWVMIVGSITNLYVYTIMRDTWYVIPTGSLLAYLGMLIGFCVAKVLKQPSARVIAISIETGIQDSGLAILLLLSSFDKPLGSISSTMAIVTAFFTPMPLLIVFICMAVHREVWKGGKCVKCGGPETQHTSTVLHTETYTPTSDDTDEI